MFSAITERSRQVRMLYLGIYFSLALGAVTMVLPFVIMLSGSVEPFPRSGVTLFPAYLFSTDELWNRFVGVKYGGNADALRAAWDDADADFDRVVATPAQDPAALALWDAFLAENPRKPEDDLLGFVQSPRLASYGVQRFRQWVLGCHGGSLEKVNRALGADFSRATMIRPPNVTPFGLALNRGPLNAFYWMFLAEHPDLRIPINAGGSYRSVFLPGRYAESIANFNAKHGTAFRFWSEIPFPAAGGGGEESDWFFFVSQVLRPDFVQLTGEGEAARIRSGMEKNEFIRTLAGPGDVRVATVDVRFAEWAWQFRGVPDARIPQRAVDVRQFGAEPGFWRWQFLSLNYQRVADEMLLHGRAFTNTAILVILYIAGALTVNPLAAYALSRFKLRQSYFILTFCMATLAFPAEVLMIPVFLQLKEWNLLNTFGALVIPNLANGFSIFLLKGFFDSLPRELYEAAELDGAGEGVMFWQVTMSLSRPILAVMALGAFTAAYGTFFYALILVPDPRLWTMMVYIFQLQSAAGYPVVYASLVLVSIPTLLVFIFCQRIILRGIVVPSEK